MGPWLRRLRELRDETVEVVAKRAGIDAVELAELECGCRWLRDAEIMVGLAQALEVNSYMMWGRVAREIKAEFRRDEERIALMD
ncbi:hypothetical protein H480_32143 [Amycolatopsis vancoresmycina DSM 44592]|uniref:XRE family transcriptional regulator n=1 Tax=Amycolatopsis vancoresmycina DSM 44592 TaxID=1292037 RepID=R1I1N8_9PSEU|nr:hypothetical protein H480_32143 [Amycolatopsis vancoresmycina DSM 44592]